MSICVSVIPGRSVALVPPPARGSSLGERVRRRLAQNPYHAVRKIDVDEDEGVLTLSGRVANFYMKQVAQAAVAKVEGVELIVNRIAVIEPVVR